jgi:hypothetical protein
MHLTSNVACVYYHYLLCKGDLHYEKTVHT